MKKIIIFYFFLLFFTFDLSKTHAQTIDPSLWQTQATGLKTQTNPDNKTAGLSVIVQNQGWPFLSLGGGVRDAGTFVGVFAFGPIGIDLGRISIPNQTASLTAESSDWSGNEMTFGYGGSQLKLWVSRLTSAVSAQSSENTLRVLSGNVTGNTIITPQNTWESSIVARPASPSYPKFVAHSSGGNVTVSPLSTTAISLPSSLDWLLVWYGTNSHFVDSKKPLLMSGGGAGDNFSIPQSETYQADTPILFVFENNPTTIKHSVEGGVEFSFPTSAGYTTLLPLLGRDHPRASDTENWGQTENLPQDVKTKADFWSKRLCQYPKSVTESYSYNPSSDTTTVTENITYLSVCNKPGSVSFAPLPPFLAIAKDALAVQFSGTVVDGNLATEFGPSLGIENPPAGEAGTNSYTWSISGLNKYTDSKRVLGSGTPPPELIPELEAQVNQIISSNHMAPWVFSDAIPRHTLRGDIYFLNPADTLYHLTEAASILPDGQTKTNLISYLQLERQNYPAETLLNLPLDQGTYRRDFVVDNTTVINNNNAFAQIQTYRQDFFQNKVPLYNLYALSSYYSLTNESVSSQLLQRASEILEQDMREQDWATMYWFSGFEDRRIAVINSNRHLTGMIGLARLAKQGGDSQLEQLARNLLAKAIIQRVAMAKYPRYLYSSGLTNLPSDPAWQPKYTAGAWVGLLFNYSWSTPFDDARQIVVLNQEKTLLNESSGFDFSWDGQSPWVFITSPYLVAFRDIVPETARVLEDFAKQDAQVYINKVEAFFPHWDLAFSEGVLGQEHNLFFPVNSFQIFLAKALIQKDSAQNLRNYLDVPWLSSGDLFYVQKLSEVIKAYKGWSWSDPPGGGQVHCIPLGDIDCSGTVNVLDLSSLISKFASSEAAADLDDSGKVNTVDLSILLSNFGQGQGGTTPSPTPTTSQTTPTPTQIPPTPTPTPSSSDLLGYWTFDEGSGTVAQDSSGNGRSLTVAGASWVAGRTGTALSFDGVNDVASSSNFTLPSSFTITGWVNNPSNQAYETILSVGQTRDIYLGSGTLAFYNGTDYLFGNIPVSSFHHIALTYDGTTLTSYVDGVQAGTSATVSLSSITDTLRIGAWIYNSSLTDYFSGIVDQVRIYNRALSTTEIQGLVDGGI